MQRRSFIKIGMSLPFLASTQSCTKSKRPNIVLILAEDMGPELGCYNYPLVKTPVLDKLSNHAHLYKNAFTTSPVCSPARSALMTGMYQTTIGAHNHRSHRDDGYELPNPVKPFTTLLQNAGYYTANGCGFSNKTDFNFSHNKSIFDGKDWKNRQPNQPFFAQITLKVTHRVFSKDEQNPINRDKVTIPSYYPDHPICRQDWANYLESIQLMDKQVGGIIERLKSENEYDNTALFFMGDNGRCHVRGKQWLYDSGIHVPLLVKMPNQKSSQKNEDLISHIDLTATILKLAGIPIPDYMQGQPFLPTNPNPREYIFAARDRCDGVVDIIRCIRNKQYKYIKNFMPEKPYMQWGNYKEFYYSMVHVMRYYQQKGLLNSAQQPFMAASKPVDELYDIQQDPEEINNLAGDKKYASVLEEMKTRLNNWIIETKDLGQTPESDEFIINLLKERKAKYLPRWEQRGFSWDASPETHIKFWEKELGIK